MALAYCPQFDCVRIDANGYSQPMEDDDIEAYNVTQDVSLGTQHLDGDGIAAARSYAANAGDVIEFTSAYPLKVRFVLAATPELAIRNNINVKYLAENLYDTAEPLSAELYLIDDDNPDAKPIRVAAGAAGGSASFPLQSNVKKNFRVIPVTTDQNLNKGSFDLDAAQPFTISGRNLETLWSSYETVANATGDDDLLSGIIPAGRMGSNGDWVDAMFAGSYVSNANEKYPSFYLDGSLIYAAAESPLGGSWKAVLTITRSSSSTARVEVQLFTDLGSGVEVVNTIVDISTLDFTAPLTVLCHGTSDANNDVLLKASHGLFYAAPVPTVYLTLGGDLATGGGTYLTE